MGYIIFAAILLFLIAVSLVIMIIPSTISTMETFTELNEIKRVEDQFYQCNEKLIETARTGTTNKCVFPVEKGEIKGDYDGIHYKIISESRICDKHPLILINEEKHLWQKCNVSGEERVLEMVWSFPLELKVEGRDVVGGEMRGGTPIGDIDFENPIEFRTLDLYVGFITTTEESGNTIEVSRAGMTSKNVTLNLKIS